MAMHTYRLSADAAEIKENSRSIRMSLIGQLEGGTRIVHVKTPADLVEAKQEMAKYVLAHNSHEIQHAAVTSPPRPLNCVHIGHRPLKRHGPGFKSLEYSLWVQREEAPVGS